MRTMNVWRRWLALILLVAPLLASAGMPANITLTGLPSSTVPGDTIAAVALVDDAVGPASGYVNFSLHNLSTNGSSILCGGVALDASGHGGCTFSAPAAGGWELVVAYGGDATYDPASAAFGFDTAQAVVYISLSGVPEATVPGSSISLTASLTTESPLGPPTGTVTFSLHDTSTNGTSILCGSVAVDASGNAGCDFSAPPDGSYQVIVDYSGDTPNAPGSLTSFTFSSQRLNPSIYVSGFPDTLLVPGMALSMNAQVSSYAGLRLPGSGYFIVPGTPTGSVDFLLHNLSTNGTSILCGSVALDASGNAGCNFAAPPQGTWELIANYSGDTSYRTATSTTGFSTQQATPTIGLTGLPAAGVTGTSTTVNAQVSSTSPLGAPSGSVDFLLHNLSTNGTSILCGSVALDASGNAGCVFPMPAPGGWEMFVDYSGDVPNAPVRGIFSFTTAPPALALDQTSMSLGPTLAGNTSAAQTVRVTNNGSVDVHFSSFVITAPTFTIASNTCASLPALTLVPGASCDIAVTFSPSAAGVLTGQLTINSDAAEGQHVLPLSGTAAAPPTFAIATFTSVTPGQVSTVTVNIRNPSGNTVTYSGFAVQLAYPAGFVHDTSRPVQTSCTAGVFTIGSPTVTGIGASGGIVSPGVSCGEVSSQLFAPTTPGTYTFTIPAGGFTIASPFPYSNPSPITATVIVAAGAPVASLTPSSLTFAARTVSTTSPAQTVTLTNTGNAPLAIASLNVAGDFAFTSACPASLAAGASCTADVTFTPLVTGARSGSLTVTDNAAGSPHVVALNGTGLSSAAPVANITPSVVVFGAQQVGTTSAPEIVTVSNAGTAPLTFSSIGVSGEFSIGTPPGASPPACPVTLAPGASCRIAIVFHPAGLNQRNGTLSIVTNAGTATLSVMGTGLVAEPPQLSMAATLDFGAQPVGVPSAGRAFEIRNTSPFVATISDLAVTGDFTVSDTCLTIAVGAACSPLITFQPSVLGPRTGTLTVRTLRDANPYTVDLFGVGEENRRPALQIAPVRVGFGNTFLGQLVTRDVVLRNSGLAPLTISGVAVSGDFFTDGGCVGSIVPGASCTVRVTFSPGIPGGRNGGLLITSNAPGSPHTVDLSGTGCVIPSLTAARLGVLLCGP